MRTIFLQLLYLILFCNVILGLTPHLSVAPPCEQIFDFSKFSSYRVLIKTSHLVWKYVEKLKHKCVVKRTGVEPPFISASELQVKAIRTVLIQEQSQNFNELHSYFNNEKQILLKDIPPLECFSGCGWLNKS